MIANKIAKGNLACDESRELLAELCKGELTIDQNLTEAIVVFVLAFMHCCLGLYALLYSSLGLFPTLFQ